MNRAIVAALVACLASSAYGAMGDLTLKAGDTLSPGWSAYMSGGQHIRPAPAGCGTVNPAAKVITLNAVDTPIQVALDSAKADDRILDVLRIDTTGTGKFTAAASIPIKWPAADGTGAAGLGPVTLTMTRNGRKAPVSVRGFVSANTAGVTSVSLSVGVCLEGECAFGDKVHVVRFVDMTGNFKMDDVAKVNLKDGVPVGVTPGDSVQINPDNMARRSGGAVGHSILVDGVWYDLAVSADEKKVTATPLKGPFGKLRMSADLWGVNLVSVDGVLTLRVKGAVDIPPGKYLLQDGMITKGSVTVTYFGLAFGQDKVTAIEVAAGKTVEDFFGPPFTTTVGAEVAGRSVLLKPRIIDAGGREVFDISADSGKPVGKFEVTGADGKVAYSAALEFS
jgi:hypothetical protein